METVTAQHSLVRLSSVQCMLEYICDKQGEVRQAASYCIGVMAQLCGDSYCSTLTGKAQFCSMYVGVYL